MDNEQRPRNGSSRDREHKIDRRFEQIERAQGDLRDHVMKALHSIELLGHEQVSFSKLMDARFLVVERSQGLAEAKMDNIFRATDGLRGDIMTMASDAAKTPAGRAIEERIAQTAKDAHEAKEVLADECRELRTKVDDLVSSKNKFEGAVWMLYVGMPCGIGALAWMVLKTIADQQP